MTGNHVHVVPIHIELVSKQCSKECIWNSKHGIFFLCTIWRRTKDSFAVGFCQKEHFSSLCIFFELIYSGTVYFSLQPLGLADLLPFNSTPLHVASSSNYTAVLWLFAWVQVICKFCAVYHTFPRRSRRRIWREKKFHARAPSGTYFPSASRKNICLQKQYRTSPAEWANILQRRSSRIVWRSQDSRS